MLCALRPSAGAAPATTARRPFLGACARRYAVSVRSTFRRVAAIAVVGTACLGVAFAGAQPPPDVEQRACDLRATRGYCIGMSALTPGVDEMLAQCATDGGRSVGVCQDDDTIAYCNLPVTGQFAIHAYHYSGRDPHRWTVERARADCTRLGGTLEVPYR